MIATFAGGCFWCTEAVFKMVKGVLKVTPGYAGDGDFIPTYETVSSGDTNFYEAIQIEFDPSVTSYITLLLIFFKTHDPTSYDRQGADIGPQYRSVVFYHSDDQKNDVNNLIKKFDHEKIFGNKIVTEVKAFKKFFEAEAYHKNFYERNKDNQYCTVVINPKIDKLVKEFSENLK